MTHPTSSLVAPATLGPSGPVRVGASDFDPTDKGLTSLTRNALQVRADKVLLREGDPAGKVYVVLDGWLAASKTSESGETQLIDFLLPGDVADPTTADGKTAGLDLEAITDASVAVIPLGSWQGLLLVSPKLARAHDSLQAAERARVSERMLRLGRSSAQTRIAYALIELCVRLKALGLAENCAFHLPLTQKHIGEFTGLTPVHVCRTLRRFVRNGIVHTADHMDIRILDIEALSRIAEIDPDRLAAEITPVGT